jgi:hypothetical protein
MVMNQKGCERKRSWLILSYYFGIYSRGLRKTIKTTVRTANLWWRFEQGNS